MSTRKTKKFWRPGEMAQVARYFGIEHRNLSAVLHRKRNVSASTAYFLQCATHTLLGKRRTILAIHWIYNKTTKHPAFFTNKKRK